MSEEREPMVTFTIEHTSHPKIAVEVSRIGIAKLAVLRTLKTRHDPEKVIIKIHHSKSGDVVGGLMVSAKAYDTLRSISELCKA